MDHTGDRPTTKAWGLSDVADVVVLIILKQESVEQNVVRSRVSKRFATVIDRLFSKRKSYNIGDKVRSRFYKVILENVVRKMPQLKKFGKSMEWRDLRAYEVRALAAVNRNIVWLNGFTVNEVLIYIEAVKKRDHSFTASALDHEFSVTSRKQGFLIDVFGESSDITESRAIMALMNKYPDLQMKTSMYAFEMENFDPSKCGYLNFERGGKLPKSCPSVIQVIITPCAGHIQSLNCLPNVETVEVMVDDGKYYGRLEHFGMSDPAIVPKTKNLKIDCCGTTLSPEDLTVLKTILNTRPLNQLTIEGNSCYSFVDDVVRTINFTACKTLKTIKIGSSLEIVGKSLKAVVGSCFRDYHLLHQLMAKLVHVTYLEIKVKGELVEKMSDIQDACFQIVECDHRRTVALIKEVPPESSNTQRFAPRGRRARRAQLRSKSPVSTLIAKL